MSDVCMNIVIGFNEPKNTDKHTYFMHVLHSTVLNLTAIFISIINLTCREATNEIKAKQNQPYVKKPPNAFMLFLKEQRPQPEFKGKSSGAVNVALALRVSVLCV